MIAWKRACEPPSERDGYRVLVERLWPRGVRKEELHLDAWAKELAPSTELRKWYVHDPTKWDEFVKRYTRELATPEARRIPRARTPQRKAGAASRTATHTRRASTPT